MGGILREKYVDFMKNISKRLLFIPPTSFGWTHPLLSAARLPDGRRVCNVWKM
jgi:hypothetical protein